MIKKYICLSVVVMLSMIAANVPQAIEIKESYKLTPEDAQTQNDIDSYCFIDKMDIETKGELELLSSWLQPGNTILASNGYIFYWIDIHDAKFYDKFIWDYFIPILSPETGIPIGEYDTLFMYYNKHWPPSLTYMPPDFSNTNPYYWQPYWRYSYIGYEEDIFNPDSCWSYAVGFSFSDFYFYDKDPGVWRTEVNMTTETNTIPTLLCDTVFNVIDDIPPTAYISYIKDCGYVGDTCTIKAGGADNAFVVKTELFIDDILVNTVAGSPMEYLWTVPQDEEIHVVQAKTYDVNNPPLYLGLCTTSGPVRVSRTNIQATQIVASNNVKLYQYQNDTIFQGHFASLYDFVVDKQIPVGAIINADKYLLFQLNLKLECYNFGQPSTWWPVCKYNIDLSEFGVPEVKGEFIGWNGSILINKPIKTIIEDHFGEHDLLLELKFEDQNGNLISEQQISLPCWVLFDKYGGNIAPKYYADSDNDGAPNWFEYWADLPALYKNITYETYQAKYAYDLPDIIYGIFYNITYRYYYIGPIVGYNTGIVLTDAYPNIIDHWEKIFKGIHAFTVICRHENLHQTQFETWWGTFREYEIRQPDEDFDRDGVPLNVETLLCTNPLLPDSDYDGLSDSDEIIASYHKIWYEDIVEGKPFDLIDWANPGKQTYPQE